MKQKNIKRTIAEYFFINPTAKLRVREIERTLSLPLPSVIRHCKDLKNEGILITLETGNVVFYTASSSKSYLLEKRLFNIKQLYASGLVEFIKKELINPAIVVFGSYAIGEDVEDSDIDLYIETPSKKHIKLDKFKRKLHRDISILQYRNIRKIPNKHLANNIINGVTLNKQMEVF